MADITGVSEATCAPVPDALDDVTAAARHSRPFVPGSTGHRAKFLAGQAVWVNGATRTSGRFAVQIAKHLGARNVMVTGREPSWLEQFSTRGADFTFCLQQDRETVSKSLMEPFRQGVDVVLDYLWGASTEELLIAAARASEDGAPLRFVPIGAASGSDITLPGAVLRSTSIELMGRGIGGIPLNRILETVKAVFATATPAKFRIDTRRIPLTDVERAGGAG